MHPVKSRCCCVHASLTRSAVECPEAGPACCRYASGEGFVSKEVAAKIVAAGPKLPANGPSANGTA